MADIKISQLGAAIAVGDTDLVPIVSGGNTLKATAAQVKEHSIGNTNISSIGDGSVTGAISALNTDKQPKTLDTPLTIGGVSKTTVEAALGGLVSENQTLTQDKVNVSDVVNDLTTTTAGKVLDARQGKTLADKDQNTRDSIAPTESGTNYSQRYTKGDRFYRYGVLYEVTASSVDSSIAINTASGGNAKEAAQITTRLLKENVESTNLTTTSSGNIVLTGNLSFQDYTVVCARGYGYIFVPFIATNGYWAVHVYDAQGQTVADSTISSFRYYYLET